jgi:hypothetical protein
VNLKGPLPVAGLAFCCVILYRRITQQRQLKRHPDVVIVTGIPFDPEEYTW